MGDHASANATMVSSRGLLLWLLGLLASVASAQDLVAYLDYGTFAGAYNAEYNISYWQKIPFAAPPVGKNRFRAPQLPLPVNNGTYDSNQAFEMCPQRTVNGSEDCLYLGLYGRPWTKGGPLRPVVVTFYGGGFIQGSASLSMPPSAYPILNVSAGNDMISVYANYRVNAFGFLPGREVAADPSSDANAGLLDQQAVLRWTRKHIAQFGGDPEQVTIWGQSAGGGSVLAQAVAHGNQDPPLFRNALASSPFWPKTPAVDSPEAQWQYDTFARLANCSGQESLACLKRADVQTLRNASLVVADAHEYTTSSFGWGPVIDGHFLTRPLSEATAGEKGGLSALRNAFAMYNAREGESFVPPGFESARDEGDPPFNSSAASFNAWLAGYLPDFSPQDLTDVKALYPPAGRAEGIPAYNDTYTRAGLVYRDSVLACPAYWLAGAGKEGRWLGEYSIEPSQHADDVYWWNSVDSAQQTDPFHYEGYAGAMASFFMTGDPDALKLTGCNASGVPALDSGREWTVTAQGFTATSLAGFARRCGFWRGVAPKVPI
ncbi:carboxylesterase [Xylariomycetidae sp. FL0641]|nr:carboxylesterase [Xylariomycetidae sp. FL0641]